MLLIEGRLHGLELKRDRGGRVRRKPTTGQKPATARKPKATASDWQRPFDQGERSTSGSGLDEPIPLWPLFIGVSENSLRATAESA